jgi:hypothetical protein
MKVYVATGPEVPPSMWPLWRRAYIDGAMGRPRVVSPVASQKSLLISSDGLVYGDEKKGKAGSTFKVLNSPAGTTPGELGALAFGAFALSACAYVPSLHSRGVKS